MTKERKLKCRFCDFTVDAVIHYKNGNTAEGAHVLTNHVRQEHPKQLKPNLSIRGKGNRDQRLVADARGEDTFGHPLPLDKIFR